MAHFGIGYFVFFELRRGPQTSRSPG